MRHAYLRKATIEDMDLLFRWANETDVRANSFSTSVITYDEHCEWYQNLLADDCRQEYIYICQKEEIGQARISIENENAEIGYSIRSDKRCMGHGRMLLQLLTEKIQIDYPQIKRLTARVKPQNAASQKAFINAGYVEFCRNFELDLVTSKVLYEGEI